MYIVQFLNVLLFRSDIKIMRPGLPECGGQAFTENGQLLFRGSFLCAALERNALLQHLHDPGRICDFGFANQEMDVLGHDHVTSYEKLIFPAGLLNDSQKDIAASG